MKSRTNAATFSAFLMRHGITNDVEQEDEGWAVWVHSEDEFITAKVWLRRFAGNPNAPDFRTGSSSVGDRRVLDHETATTLARRISELQPGARVGSMGFGPLTVAVAVGCFLLGLASTWGSNLEMLAPLFMTRLEPVGSMVEWQPGLREVLSGELWRIWTPALVHFGFLHLVFNLLWFVALGSQIESRQSTGRLILLVLLIGAASNLAQFWIAGPYFGGLSGIVYGLLGYVWMKCRHQPASGFHISLNSVTLMMIWYFLCLLGIVPQAANTAHTVGLLAGFALGFLATRLGQVR